MVNTLRQPLEAFIIDTPVYQRLLYVLKHPSDKLYNDVVRLLKRRLQRHRREK
ncbi:MAG: hypothetical protein J6I31_04125 [Prevotella sp.]|nr:hypothetical protein [Prevotella sp.]